MFAAFPVQFILYLYIAATFESPEGGHLIEVGVITFCNVNLI